MLQIAYVMMMYQPPDTSEVKCAREVREEIAINKSGDGIYVSGRETVSAQRIAMDNSM